jgi:hypothetical protein
MKTSGVATAAGHFPLTLVTGAIARDPARGQFLLLPTFFKARKRTSHEDVRERAFRANDR